MCKEAGICEQKTNHSLRATGTTAMFNASVPEKMIREVTGHRSSALHLYERPTLKQQKDVTSVLMSSNDMEKQPVTLESHVDHHTSSVGAVQEAKLCPPPSAIGAMFSGLTNCSISITPQNFIVNLHYGSRRRTSNFQFPLVFTCAEAYKLIRRRRGPLLLQVILGVPWSGTTTSY